MFQQKYNEFRTLRLNLLKYNLKYSKDVFSFYCNQDVMKWTGIKIHEDIKHTNNFIKNAIKTTNNLSYIFWVIKHLETNKIIGDISIKPDYTHKFASLGTFLAKEFWQQGYMFEALQPIIWFAFNNLNINRLEAQFYTKHIASKRLFEKSGFKFEGILRQNFLIKNMFENSCMYSLLKSEYKNSENFKIIK